MSISKSQIGHDVLVDISRVHHVSTTIREAGDGLVLPLMDVVRVNHSDTNASLLSIRDPSSPRLIEIVHQSIWIHVNVSTEVVLESVLETALVEVFNSRVFVPDDNSGETVSHGFDVVLRAFGALPAASRLILGSFGLEFVELILLVLV